MAKKRRKGSTRRAAKRGFRRAARGVRRFARRARGIRLSILGKAGVATVAVPPLAFAAIDAMGGFFRKDRQYDLPSRLRLAAATAIDSLSRGFGAGTVFGNVYTEDVNGASASTPTVPTSPAGGWQKTTLLGVTMIVTDAVQSFIVNFATKKKGVRVGGMQMTSGR